MTRDPREMPLDARRRRWVSRLAVMTLLTVGVPTGGALADGGADGVRGAGEAAPPPTPPPAVATTTAGPPAWVTPGLRLTYYTSFAELAAGTYELIEDPNGPLLDAATGRRYRESYTGTPTADAAGGSGDGFSETTVLASEGSDVILARSLYLNEPLSGTMSVGSSSASRVAAATGEGLWMAPETLATLRSGDQGIALVLRGQVTVANTAYEAVSLVNPQPGNYSMFTYDSKTGILLTSAIRSQPTQGGPLQMGFTELRGTRQIAVPGLGAAPPSWVADRPTLTYSGVVEFVNPMSPTMAPITTPLSRTVTITQSGATWVLFETRQDASAADPPGTAASAGTGPYWWDPAALATLATGQVLDTDPVTGLTLKVGAVDGSSVTIESALRGMTGSARYDRATGVMLSSTVTLESWGQTFRVELQQRPA